MKLALGSQKYGSAHQLCIVYSALHMMSHASNASCIAHTQAPFIAILCLTVKIVLGIASSRGHCLQEPQMGQSYSTTTGQSSRCPLLRGKKKKKKLPLQKDRQARTKESTPTHDACPCTPVRRKAPSSLARLNIPVWIVHWNSVCQTPVEFLGLRSVQK